VVRAKNGRKQVRSAAPWNDNQKSNSKGKGNSKGNSKSKSKGSGDTCVVTGTSHSQGRDGVLAGRYTGA